MTDRVKLTKRTVDAVGPLPEAERFVWDTELPGFRLRITPTGRKFFELRYRNREGRQRLQRIGAMGVFTPDQARDEARKLLREVESGGDPRAERRAKRAALTVAQLVERFLEEGPIEKPSKKPISWATDAANLRRHAIPLLGTRLASELTPGDLARWQRAVADGKTAVDEKTGPRGRAIVTGGKGIADRSMRSLSAMLGWAVRAELLKENPALNVAKMGIGRRNRFLGKEEAAAFTSAIDKLESEARIRRDSAAVFRLLAFTGARRGEILGLRWCEVDFERGVLVLAPDRHKTGRSGGERVIQLRAAAADILKGRPRSSTWVFPNALETGPIASPRDDWAKLCKAAGLDNLRMHDLRHSYASLLVREGVPLQIVGKALGHTSTATTARYAHLRDEATIDAFERVERIYRAQNADSR